MRAVNLLPREDARAKRKPPALPVLVGAAGTVLVGAALAGGFMLERAKVADKRSALEGLRAELAALPPPRAQPAAQAALAQEEKQRRSALSDAVSRRLAWDRVLREVSLILPHDVWLTSLTALSPGAPAVAGPAPPGAADGLTVKGYTYSQDAVARFLARLAVVPNLTNVQLVQSTRTQLFNHPVFQFAIVAGVRPPGASA